MNKFIVASALVLAFGTATAQAEQYRVVDVSDGDTVRVLSGDKQQVKCRLHGIDAPESRQAYGQVSKTSLSEMVFGKTVSVEILDQDQYGRSVCRVMLNGVDVNKVQLQRGLAWHYSRYDKSASYAQAERTARQQRLGLWTEPDPTAPWSFRRENKR